MTYNASIQAEPTPYQSNISSQSQNELTDTNLFNDEILDIFSQDSSHEFLMTEPIISNPKHTTNQAKKMTELKKEYKSKIKTNLLICDTLKKKLIFTHKIIISAIKNKDSKNFSLNLLSKLFQDPYFLGQVQLSNTKSGVLVTAHNRATNQNMTTSTHRSHNKKAYQDSAIEFLKKLNEILKMFNI